MLRYRIFRFHRTFFYVNMRVYILYGLARKIFRPFQKEKKKKKKTEGVMTIFRTDDLSKSYKILTLSRLIQNLKTSVDRPMPMRFPEKKKKTTDGLSHIVLLNKEKFKKEKKNDMKSKRRSENLKTRERKHVSLYNIHRVYRPRAHASST